MAAAAERGWLWYLWKEEIERRSLSRRNDVGAATEAQLRATYCSFILDVRSRLAAAHLHYLSLDKRRTAPVLHGRRRHGPPLCLPHRPLSPWSMLLFSSSVSPP